MFRLTDLVDTFPSLPREGYRRTSPEDIDYNCLAWALNDSSRWWDINDIKPSYWPDGVQRVWNRRNILKIFRLHGFELCADDSLEGGKEKVAVYLKDGIPEHFARQLPTGEWTSKIGELDDITHTLMGLAGDHYGNPELFLSRSI